jgi:hypothetical protein
MTITERNERLQDLRNQLTWLRTQEIAVEESIRQVNRQYKDGVMFQSEDLFTQMF